MLDPKGRIRGWNPEAETIFGWSADEVLGQSCAIIFTPEERRERVPEQELAQAQKTGVTFDDRWHIRKDGTRLWASGSVTILRDDQGVHLGFAKIVQDRTEFKQRAEALQQSEAWLRRLMDALPDMVWTASARGDTTYLNERWFTYTGMPKGQGLGTGWQVCLHPDDLPSIAQAWSQALQNLDLYEVEQRIRAADNSFRWFLTRAVPVFDEYGNLVQWFGTSTDIHQRKLAEQELDQRTKQQAVVVELGLFALAHHDIGEVMSRSARRLTKSLQVDYCSVLELQPGGQHLLLKAGTGWAEASIGSAVIQATPDTQAGYTLMAGSLISVEDLRSEKRFDGSQPLHEAGIISGISTVIEGREGPYGVVGAHTTSRRSFGEDEKTFFQAVANILSEAVTRKKAEEAIKQSQGRIERVLEVITEAFYALDSAWRFTYVNREAEKLLGRSREELLGQVVWEEFPDAENAAFHDEYHRAVREKIPVRIEEYYPALQRQFEIRAYPFDEGLSVFFSDITDRKRVEEERRRLELERALEEQLIRERKRVGRELHDGLRQQLVGIRMLAAHLHKKLEARSLPEAKLMEEFTDLISEANLQVRALINDLVPVHITAEHLTGALERAARNVEQWYGILCRVTAPSTLSCPDETANHLYYIAVEAMTNAAKHSNATEVTLAVRTEGKVLTLQVSDNGSGLPADYDKRGSMGIMNMRYRAELVGAQFRIASKVAEGTTVTCKVSLPKR